MEQRTNGFQAIVRGKSGRFYSERDMETGKIPEAEEPTKTNIVYDSHSYAMYFQVHMGNALALRTPYINKNSKYCCFMNGEVVEASRRQFA